MSAKAATASVASITSPAIAFTRDTGKIVPFVANNKSTQELDRGMVLRELYLRLTGQITATAANNIAANMFPGDEWALVNDITLRTNGRDVMKRISGRALRWLQYYLYGTYPLKALNQLGNGVTANPSFDSTLIIPLWMPKSVSPMNFALDTRTLSRLDLEITWNNYQQVNSTATSFITNPQIQVYVNEVTNVQGKFSKWNLFPITSVIAAATQKYQVKIPVGYMYRSFMIHDESAIISSMYIRSGPTEWANIPVQLIQTILENDRRASSSIMVTGANNNWLCGATGDDLEHFMYFDQVSDGHNSESFDTFGLSEFYLEFDTTGAGTVVVYPNQLVVARG